MEESKNHKEISQVFESSLIESEVQQPKLGDIGCLEENDKMLEVDKVTQDALIEEESEFLICNNELIDLIAENSVKLTEAQMREAEGEYQMVGEEEESSKLVQDLINEQKISNLGELKLKLGKSEEIAENRKVVDITEFVAIP